MKHKVLLITAGVLVVGAAITSGLVFGLKTYRNKIQAKKEKINKEAEKIIANYDEKSKIEAKDADATKIKFTGVDLNKYIINIKNVKVMSTDNTKLVVIFILTDKNEKTVSDNIEKTISGFKKNIDLKAILNKKIEAIVKAKYNEPTINIYTNEAKEEKIIFESVEDGYETSIKNISTKLKDQTVLLVIFTLKEVNGNVESDKKMLEISGFKQPEKPIIPKTKEELNIVSKSLNKLSYQDEKKSVTVKNIDKNKILIIDIPNGYNYKITEISAKKENPTTAVITFTINENGGEIESEKKTLEIDGFRKPFLTINELDAQIEKVDLATFKNGDKSNIKVINITGIMIQIDGLKDGIEAKIIDIKPKIEDSSIAVITFQIKEIDGVNSSKSKTIEIPGFKLNDKTVDELDKIVENISKASYTDANQSSTTVLGINQDAIKLDGLEEGLEIKVINVEPKAENKTIAIVTFVIKEIGKDLKSKEKQIEITGFRQPFLTVDELNNIVDTVIDVSFKNDDVETKKITAVKDIDKKLLTPIGLIKPELEFIVTDISAKPGDTSTAIISIQLKEKDGKLKSKINTHAVSGFKKVALTKEELDKLLEKIDKIEFLETRAEVEIKDIDKKKIKFNNIADYLKADIESLTSKETEKTTLVVKFTISEKDGTIKSKSKTLQLRGFKQPTNN